jgi:hypothetical protein
LFVDQITSHFGQETLLFNDKPNFEWETWLASEKPFSIAKSAIVTAFLLVGRSSDNESENNEDQTSPIKKQRTVTPTKSPPKRKNISPKQTSPKRRGKVEAPKRVSEQEKAVKKESKPSHNDVQKQELKRKMRELNAREMEFERKTKELEHNYKQQVLQLQKGELNKIAELIRSAQSEEEFTVTPQAQIPAKMKKPKFEKENMDEIFPQRSRSPETTLREIHNIKLLKHNYEEKQTQNASKLERIPKQNLINNSSLSYLQRIHK